MSARLPRTAGLACAATLALALAATADEGFVMYLDTPEACAATQDMDYEERPFRAIHDGGAMLLSPWGMEAVEYYCAFEGEILLDWSEERRQVRLGYCEEPGPWIEPKVFVIATGPTEPEVAYVWASGDPVGEPTVFTACRQM